MRGIALTGVVLAACGGSGGTPQVDIACEPAPAGSQTFQCTIKVRDRGAVDYQVRAGERRVAAGRTDRVAVTRLAHRRSPACRRFMVTPNLHRWHHSRLQREQQCNLGAILIVWDVVFGSRHAPADRAPPEQVGPGVDRYPQTFLAQLAAPFRRALWRPEASG